MQSENINELAKALSKAQGEIKGAKKDSENPFFHSSYADLASVWDACREPLSKNGLSVVQTTDLTENGTVLITTLLHDSGQWIRGTYPLLSKDNTAQALGSATTYARRYALQAIVGVAAEDDDGNAATHEKNAPRLKPDPRKDVYGPPPKKPQVEATQTQRTLLFWRMSKEKGWSDVDVKEKMVSMFRKEKTADLSAQELAVLWGVVETNPKAAQKSAE